MDKYPFVVTVYRMPGGQKPPIQQHSFETLELALLAMNNLGRDKLVMKATLAAVLKTQTFNSQLRGGRDD